MHAHLIGLYCSLLRGLKGECYKRSITLCNFLKRKEKHRYFLICPGESLLSMILPQEFVLLLYFFYHDFVSLSSVMTYNDFYQALNYAYSSIFIFFQVIWQELFLWMNVSQMQILIDLCKILSKTSRFHRINFIVTFFLIILKTCLLKRIFCIQVENENIAKTNQLMGWFRLQTES